MLGWHTLLWQLAQALAVHFVPHTTQQTLLVCQSESIPEHERNIAAPAATAAWPNRCTALCMSWAIGPDECSAAARAVHSLTLLRKPREEYDDKLFMLCKFVSLD